MATQKAVMCSMLLILLVFASNWDDATARDNPACWKPSDNKISCVPMIFKNKKCNKECILENYEYGKCVIIGTFLYRCMCHKPNCEKNSVVAMSIQRD
ncbi:hypothetical protein ACP70R_032249 [Stipagrostis hirtigluma subsp. patula]